MTKFPEVKTYLDNLEQKLFNSDKPESILERNYEILNEIYSYRTKMSKLLSFYRYKDPNKKPSLGKPLSDSEFKEALEMIKEPYPKKEYDLFFVTKSDRKKAMKLLKEFGREYVVNIEGVYHLRFKSQIKLLEKNKIK